MPNADLFDLLVIGSGVAGLAAALKAAELHARVAVLTAGPVLAGSSVRAQGGLAAAVGADDTPALHASDTLSVGAGLNDAVAVDVLTAEAPASVRRVLDAGTPFERDLGLEAGHARRRILHAGGGATGQVLTRTLLERARLQQRIAVIDHAPVHGLELASERVTGVRAGARRFRAGATILATGGYAALWARTTNAPETRGSGLFLAWQAGASLADLEFVQFHPTALNVPGQPAFLLSEALRGEGGRLIDQDGHDIVDPLLPRDVVARALHRQLRGGGQAFLSLQHLDSAYVYRRFAQIAAHVRTLGLDLARDPLPVAPAAHYCMGGVRTDSWGRTDVVGLYAAGEVACTGAQGANRLASNSLLECLVFGARAAQAALTDHAARRAPAPARELGVPALGDRAPDPLRPAAADQARLAARLDADVGVERTQAQLQRLVDELPGPEAGAASEVVLASLIARAALLRRESRGAHFRVDAPRMDPAWRGRILWRRGHPPAFERIAEGTSTSSGTNVPAALSLAG